MVVAYIAHPIAGDVRGNTARIHSIIAELARSEPGILPFAPYLTALQVLDDLSRRSAPWVSPGTGS